MAHGLDGPAGLGASVVLANTVYGIHPRIILDSAARAVTSWDLITSMIKAWVFGVIIAVVRPQPQMLKGMLCSCSSASLLICDDLLCICSSAYSCAYSIAAQVGAGRCLKLRFRNQQGAGFLLQNTLLR